MTSGRNRTENASDMAAARPEVAEMAPGAPEPAAVATAEEVAELKDRLLRGAGRRECQAAHGTRVEDARKYAVTGFARDLLEVVRQSVRGHWRACRPEARTQNEFLGHLRHRRRDDRAVAADSDLEMHKVQKVLAGSGASGSTTDLPSGDVRDAGRGACRPAPSPRSWQPGYVIGRPAAATGPRRRGQGGLAVGGRRRGRTTLGDAGSRIDPRA